MIEVESKVYVRNPSLVRKLARKLGKYTGTEIKIDDYYTQERLDGFPKDKIRIRKINRHHIVNFKRKLSYDQGVHAKEEIEHEVIDIKKFMKLIKNLGFRKWMKKEKKCEIYQIKKNFHIELNNVKGLGWFVEIEYLIKNPSSIKKARVEVVRVMSALGFKKKDAIKKGYTKLIWEKRHKR